MARFRLPQLLMSAKRSVWRMHDHGGEGDKEFKQVRASVLEDSGNACAFCHMKSSKFQEVHHIDDDHKNNSKENLCCTCPLCHQVFHIGLAGMKDGGKLVYLPELTQEEVNQLALIIWIATNSAEKDFTDPEHAALVTRLSGRAKTLESALGGRQGTVVLRIKAAIENTDFPQELVPHIKISYIGLSLLSNVLMSLDDADYARRGDLLGGLRLLPSPERFKSRIDYWIQEQATVLPLPAWYKILPDEEFVKIVGSCNEQLSNLMQEFAPIESVEAAF